MIPLSIIASTVAVAIGLAICNGELDDGSTIVSRVRRFSGGTHVYVEPHPTVVQILYYDHRACDGSILSEFFILTAAHCVMEFWYEKMTVVAYSDNGPSLHGVTNVEYHANNFPKNGTNDVAILKLRDPITRKNGITYVKLAKNYGIFPLNDKHVTSYKWSDDRDDDESMILTASVDTLLTKEECARHFERQIESLVGLLCARTRHEEKIANQMTGGPVMFGSYQVGIIIIGKYVDRQPVFYTNVTAFIDWIDATKLQLLKTDKPGTTYHNLPREELDYNYQHSGESTVGESSISTVSIINETGKLMCVGSVVSIDMILTTARCAKKGFENFRARVVSKIYAHGFKEYQITKAHVHDDFDAKMYPHVHDVALLRVSPDFSYSKAVRPIEIVPLGEEIKVYHPDWVYGYVGRSDLRRVESCVIPKDECDWLYRKSGGLREGMICAKSFYGWCNHVAGEPLIVGIKRQLAGIMTATSQECADHRDPAVFINVTANLDWINKKLSYLDEKREGL